MIHRGNTVCQRYIEVMSTEPIDPQATEQEKARARARIHTVPDPVLRTRASEVDPADPDLPALIAEMVEIMRLADGVGLAAPQMGISKRVIVVRIGDPPLPPLVILNPEIHWTGEHTEEGMEGCLSIPGVQVPVARFTSIRVRGLDEHGDEFGSKMSGFLARVIQHEVDHLDGVLITDRTRPEIRRELALAALPAA